MDELIKNYAIIIASSITGVITLLTVAVTQIVNSKMQKRQLNHQKEMGYIEHFLDKRTAAVLEFREILEESFSLLDYFHSSKADFERQEMLKAEYINPFATPKTQEDIIPDSITLTNMTSMFDHGLKQIEPIEEKFIQLDTSFNLLSIYLSEDEEKLFIGVIKDIQQLAHNLIGGLRHYKEKGDPQDDYVLKFVHIEEPYRNSLESIRKKLKTVRLITKQYLYIHQLDK